MTIREKSEREERERLSPYAKCCLDSAGRQRPEEPCPMRTDFQRDRDRILHCKSFRRLMHKTQVFLSPEGDHYRTRLTHTLEVSQIARTIARSLRLNEDLTEAMALGHDLGHTPFGHAGEYALREVCEHGFVHAQQSVRVLERLENDGRGLNLCAEVLDGVRCHSSGQRAQTLEGRVVRYADKIAYMNHDIDDAIRAGVLGISDIPWDLQYILGRTKSQRITAMVVSLVENSSDDIRMSEDIQGAFDKLHKFMFEAVYTNPAAKGEEGKAKEVVKSLFSYFVAHPDKLPGEYHGILEEEGAHRAASDYISGMSDRYAVSTFQSLFIPKSWSL
ncbi:MAG: deoxyguanosinetriphosphate triphosphohydrolase [Clostridiales bacterium]|uniref:deoxyguanosinetriphosphate triphosphohydrolase n=1 Tax=Provencibacterium massiliense TaxID=1841868 RepID=UPI0009A835A8|nr:deoxyguanosinetriphosphate triphosphohydrolase [Provencibacterium massiliense]PWM39141.1 MAG: deoxyguanosinetriphosphate triphosphohydrolase [Clostridiales bacterium]RGB68786.1 deoxyguanosinetriphosphate triphosphohydrolase [Harryflintia acetispora]